MWYRNNDGGDCSEENLCSGKDGDNLKANISNGGGANDAWGNHSVKPPLFQRGVLRTNCIDCLDRTNVAQYAYGLVALGHQLHALGLIDAPNIDLDSPLADNLMRVYETMGDTLALQYGGSAAHNKVILIIVDVWHIMLPNYVDAKGKRSKNLWIIQWTYQPDWLLVHICMNSCIYKLIY